MVTINFYSLLRMKIGLDTIELPWEEGDTVARFLEKADAAAGSQVLHPLIENERMRSGTIILVNGHNIHHLEGLQTRVGNGDVLALFPPAAGG